MRGSRVNIFDCDEVLSKVQKQWTEEQLLAQPALFFLRDVCAKLGLMPVAVAAHAKTIAANGEDPYIVMGLRKIWNHWYVRMRVFETYYRLHLKSHIKSIQRGWDANTLLAQKGVFILSQVCKCIPFSSGQLRHQQRKISADVCGIYRQDDGLYLVDMEVFGPWLSRLWQEGFGSAVTAVAKSKRMSKEKAPKKKVARPKKNQDRRLG